MKAAAKLRAVAGSNITEFMSRQKDRAGESPNLQAAPAESDRYAGLNRVKGAFMIPLDRITPDPDQPRKEFDEEGLNQLAASLRDRGQVQSIRVRWDSERDKWIIIAGERRWRAAGIAGLPALACVEAKGAMSADEILEEQLVENCLREDLRPVEQARAFKALMDRRGWSYRQVAEHLHVSKAAVGRAVSLLGLPVEIQDHVDAGEITPSLAVELTKVEDPAEQRALTENALKGQDTYTTVARRRTEARRPIPTKSTFRLGETIVTVTIDRPDAPHRDVVAGLRAALWKATDGREGNPLDSEPRSGQDAA